MASFLLCLSIAYLIFFYRINSWSFLLFFCSNYFFWIYYSVPPSFLLLPFLPLLTLCLSCLPCNSISLNFMGWVPLLTEMLRLLFSSLIYNSLYNHLLLLSLLLLPLFLSLWSVTTLRSNSGCNTQVKTRGWIESRGRKGMIQLVKCKEYRRVSTVYIPMYHEKWMRNTCGRHEVCWVKNMLHQWGADWAIRYMKWYKTKKWSMWLHHGKHLYGMRSIITISPS